MARDTRQYDPGQVITNIGGRDVTGYAPGTFVELKRNKEAFTISVGSDGEITRVKSQDRSGTIKVTLKQDSPLNDYFSSLATQDERTSDAAVPGIVKDANGTTLGSAQKLWVKKKPDTAFSDASENREWEFETGFLDLTIGGENLL